MALETVRPAEVQTPQNEPRTPVGTFESLKAGIGSGWEYNTVFSLIPDAIQGQEMANNPFDQVDPDLYHEGHPFYIDDLPHDQGVSYKHLYEMFTSRQEAAKYSQIFQDGGLIDKGAFVVGALGTAVLDPITYIPVPFLKGVTTFGKQALAIGAFNAALEVPLYPLINEAYKQRGMGKYEYDELVAQMGLAFVAGGGLTTLMRGGGYGLSKIRAARLKALDPLEREVQNQKVQHPNYDYDNTVRDMISKEVLHRNQLDFDSIRKHTFMSNSVEDFWVDTAGRRKFIVDDVTDNDVKITSQADQTKLVEGKRDSILKIAKSLIDRSDESKGALRYILKTIEDGKLYDVDLANLKKWIDSNIPGAQERLTAKINASKPFYDLSKYINKSLKFRADLDSWDNVLYDRGKTFEIVPDPERGIDIENNIGKFYKLNRVEFDPAVETAKNFRDRQEVRKKQWANEKINAKGQNKEKFMFEGKEYNIRAKFPTESKTGFPERVLVTDIQEKKSILLKAKAKEAIRREALANDKTTSKDTPLYDPEHPDHDPGRFERRQALETEESIGLDRHEAHNIRQDLKAEYGDTITGYQAASREMINVYGEPVLTEIGFRNVNGMLIDDGLPARPLTAGETAIRNDILEKYKAIETDVVRYEKETALCLRTNNTNF